MIFFYKSERRKKWLDLTVEGGRKFLGDHRAFASGLVGETLPKATINLVMTDSADRKT